MIFYIIELKKKTKAVENKLNYSNKITLILLFTCVVQTEKLRKIMIFC